ncbi:hypothetical protein MTO96_025811 [Rhipicephalus appendiculatus]
MLLVLLLAFAHSSLPTVVDALGVPYSLVVLGHDDLVNDKTTRIWDSDDSTCFSMPSELNETLASVRLFLDPPYRRWPRESRVKTTTECCVLPSGGQQQWIPNSRKGRLRRQRVDLRRGAFGQSDNIDKIDLLPRASGRAASSQQQATTGKLSGRLILYATLPVMAVAAILAAVLFWKRRKVPCLRASYASGLHPAKRQGRRSLPLTPDDEDDDDSVPAFDTSDTAALFHSRISGQPEWTQSHRNGHHRGSNPDIISDLAFANHLLEVSHEYATLELPPDRDSGAKHQDV